MLGDVEAGSTMEESVDAGGGYFLFKYYKATDLESKATEAFVDNEFELTAEVCDDRAKAHIMEWCPARI